MKKTILLSMYMLCVVAFASAQSIIVDDAVQGTSLNQHNYVGAGWVHGSTSPAFYNSTLSYSNVAGAYVTLFFVGNRIEWWTEKKSTHGIAAVSIDGGPETFVDLYSSSEQHLTVYSSPTINQGGHTFKIRVTGTKNAASSGLYVVHDYSRTKELDAETDITNTFAGALAGVGPGYGFPPFFNTGLGYRALGNNNGTNNTAVGGNALVSTSGAQNVAVGNWALTDGSSSWGNTAVGFFALYTYGGGPKYPPAITHGSDNTAVGTRSGPRVSGLFNTTSLGAGASATASNQIRIGNNEITSIGGQVSWSTLSDGRFKRDLREDVSGLEFVNKLRPLSYMVDKTAVQKFLGVPDSIINSKGANKEKPIRQTGFVAQEVDALVKKSGYVFSGVDVPKNDKDPYTIRYSEFVVPLVKAVQELSAMVDEQQQQIAEQEKHIAEQQKQIDQLLGKTEEGNGGFKSSEISLLQNNPNPFSVTTEIKMVLPETAGSANIIVYNLEGKQLKQLQVKGRGNVSATILGNELSAGMYIYALIVDGKVVDTKRMILTK